MSSILFGRFPGKIETVSIENEETVQSVLQKFNIQPSSDQTIFVSGVKVDPDHPLRDGDKLFLLAPIRGEVTAKVSGNIWRMHQNDPDAVFPSDLHAHNLTAPEVVDLYDGRVYDAKTRNIIRRLSKKELTEVREKLGVN